MICGRPRSIRRAIGRLPAFGTGNRADVRFCAVMAEGETDSRCQKADVRMHEGRRDRVDVLAGQPGFVSGHRGCGHRDRKKCCTEQQIAAVHHDRPVGGCSVGCSMHDHRPNLRLACCAGASSDHRAGFPVQPNALPIFVITRILLRCPNIIRIHRSLFAAAQTEWKFRQSRRCLFRSKEVPPRRAHECRSGWRHACLSALTISSAR